MNPSCWADDQSRKSPRNARATGACARAGRQAAKTPRGGGGGGLRVGGRNSATQSMQVMSGFGDSYRANKPRKCGIAQTSGAAPNGGRGRRKPRGKDFPGGDGLLVFVGFRRGCEQGRVRRTTQRPERPADARQVRWAREGGRYPHVPRQERPEELAAQIMTAFSRGGKEREWVSR